MFVTPNCVYWLYWPILGSCHIPIGKKVVIKVQINWLKCLFIPAPRSVQAIWSEKVGERSSYLFRILVGPHTTKFSTTIFALLYWLLEWCKTILLLFLVRPWCLPDHVNKLKPFFTSKLVTTAIHILQSVKKRHYRLAFQFSLV